MSEAPPLPLPVREGDVLASKYRIDRHIGTGSMAAVFRATHLELEQVVAMKLLRPEHVSRPDAVKRFLRDARAAVRLRSAHVARVLDVGTVEITPTEQVPYMIMEHLEGNDFETLLETQGRFPTEDAVEYILQACDAIAEAHALGIVHRDLQPANLFLTTNRDGDALVKLLDFGISKDTKPKRRPADQKITADHAMPGTPAYMSPEQVRSTRDADARADIWSLGAILFELLTGRAPWIGETSGDTFAMILSEPAPSMRALRSDIDPDLEVVVLRCLEKDRAARFQTAADLAMALVRFVPQRSLPVMPTSDTRIPTPPSSIPSQRIPLLDSQRNVTPQPPPPPSPRPAASAPPKVAPRWRLPVLIGVVIGILALAGVILVVFARP